MYHWVLRKRVRALWRKVGRGEFEYAITLASEDIRFRFIGDTPISAEFTGRDRFRQWFEDLFDLFPGLRLTLTDVVSRGWPWRTTVAVRLSITATLADGSIYRNEATQWLMLKWGRMMTDDVLEDTKELDRACRIQSLNL
ncbi:nuclear transport factor 2 family protein [Streptomyces bacillaris]|uniref:nuclear transport factor 2 family protein n=1 Tax=Streptomyces bacillaris TaxID=68179 RepID=UPI0036DA1305